MIRQPRNPNCSRNTGSGINDGYSRLEPRLQARRFVEAGVRFVEIRFEGWDTHADNFNQVQTLSGSLDAALSALVADLGEHGLFDHTQIACFGEFGRTPKIKGDNVRDHYPNVFSALLAGGGVKSGQVIGRSSEDGRVRWKTGP